MIGQGLHQIENVTTTTETSLIQAASWMYLLTVLLTHCLMYVRIVLNHGRMTVDSGQRRNVCCHTRQAMIGKK